MALPPFINKAQITWLFKVTKQTSPQPVRDRCLLGLFFLTPCTTLEINRIQLGDVLHKNGRLNKEFRIKGVLAFNGNDRVVYLTNRKLREFIRDYIDHRAKKGIGPGNHPDQYLGLDPDEPLLFTNNGAGFSIVKKETPKGNITYRSDALNRHVKDLMSKSGIECPSILSGRRTFAVMLKQKGVDVALIHFLLGNKSLKTTDKLFTTDPVDMAAIADTMY